MSPEEQGEKALRFLSLLAYNGRIEVIPTNGREGISGECYPPTRRRTSILKISIEGEIVAEEFADFTDLLKGSGFR